MPSSRAPAARLSGSLLDPRVIDPQGELVNRTGLGADELEEIVQVLTAVRDWREAEQRMSFRSRSHMQLNETDMEALRFVIAATNQDVLVTPGALADHLKISTASTTKLLDRLAAAGHVERSPHPSDRRALVITVTDTTRREVRKTVGVQHAARFEAARRLDVDERHAVIRFLNSLSDIERSHPAVVD